MKDRYLHVQASMRDASARALLTFARLNPHWNGAEWADCLEALCESDSHLDVTEPIAIALRPRLYGEQKRYVDPVVMTLLYCGAYAGGIPEDVVLEWVLRLCPDEVPVDDPAGDLRHELRGDR